MSSTNTAVNFEVDGMLYNQGVVISRRIGVLDSAVATITNAGSISGYSVGVYLLGGGSLVNKAGGTISSGNDDVDNATFAATIDKGGVTARLIRTTGFAVIHAHA